ncbi:hypothetical protein O181_118576, partial [Austropuccinia psidii MF-1]|nr:hypothetical protein [Austropuccinia psidii MF-1]
TTLTCLFLFNISSDLYMHSERTIITQHSLKPFAMKRVTLLSFLKPSKTDETKQEEFQFNKGLFDFHFSQALIIIKRKFWNQNYRSQKETLMRIKFIPPTLKRADYLCVVH